jgi:hypothetical protein
MIHRRIASMAALAAALTFGLAACGGNSLAPSSRADVGNLPSDGGFARFTDIPVPKGADMDNERSLVLGTREAWVGRLVMSVSDRPATMYDFYARQMPGFGWRPITSVRGEVSTLTFARGDRVATVQLYSRTLWGSEVRLTMSPQHGDVPPTAASDLPGTAMAPNALRADERVQSAPLR